MVFSADDTKSGLLGIVLGIVWILTSSFFFVLTQSNASDLMDFILKVIPCVYSALATWNFMQGGPHKAPIPYPPFKQIVGPADENGVEPSMPENSGHVQLATLLKEATGLRVDMDILMEQVEGIQQEQKQMLQKIVSKLELQKAEMMGMQTVERRIVEQMIEVHRKNMENLVAAFMKREKSSSSSTVGDGGVDDDDDDYGHLFLKGWE